MSSNPVSTLKRVISSASKLLLITISLAVIGAIVLKTVELYQVHVPPVREGRCLILDVGQTVDYLKSDEVVLSAGAVLQNDVLEGKSLIRIRLADLIELDVVVDFYKLRGVGFIRTECAK